MDKNVRIWIDGELLIDEPVRVDEIDFGSLSGAHRETVVHANKQGHPWRIEVGDRDADVKDRHWR
jgi:hypothetical protein